ncbi:hypothetical protein Anapl_14332 [Anas platyrhynchos]|uniref:Uncharacterized protein n=1 Tax=Anas platyrhynchos TaxID=8839 RepID=R0LLW1_ANAPL|nr:hypothetical protein Anapl_14332 [Anas platyrhynchos]
MGQRPAAQVAGAILKTAFRRVHNAHYVNDPTDIRNLKDKKGTEKYKKGTKYKKALLFSAFIGLNTSGGVQAKGIEEKSNDSLAQYDLLASIPSSPFTYIMPQVSEKEQHDNSCTQLVLAEVIFSLDPDRSQSSFHSPCMSLHAITANWQITINPRPQNAQVEEQLLRWTANPGIAMRECDNRAKFISHTIHNSQQLHAHPSTGITPACVWKAQQLPGVTPQSPKPLRKLGEIWGKWRAFPQ